MNKTLGFIGFGKMANAICGGIVKSEYLKKSSVFAYDINRESLAENTKKLGVNPVSSIEELVKKSDYILVATKPFIINDILEQIKDIAQDKLIISILAGISTKTYEDALGNVRVVRVMPNTPAMVNNGMSVVCRGNYSTDEDVDFVYNMFLKLGKALILDESKINAVTAVSGSGPAFYYYIIDKIARAGEVLGLDYKDALLLSAQTALGASKMIMETGTSPEDLIKAVTTPNGTTAEGNKVLIESDIEKVLFETINKTNQRAIELGAKK